MLWPWRLTPTARPAERYWVTCAWMLWLVKLLGWFGQRGMLWMGVAYFKTRAPGCACVHLNFWDCCCRGLWVASVVCSCWCHFCWLVFAPFRLCVVLRFHCFPAVSLLCRFSFCAVPFVVSVPRFLVHVCGFIVFLPFHYCVGLVFAPFRLLCLFHVSWFMSAVSLFSCRFTIVSV